MTRRTAYFICAGSAFLFGDSLIAFGTAEGFACPGCGLHDRGVQIYTLLPWIGGAILLVAAGLLYRCARPQVSLFDAIASAIVFGLGALFAVFVIFVIAAAIIR